MSLVPPEPLPQSVEVADDDDGRLRRVAYARVGAENHVTILDRRPSRPGDLNVTADDETSMICECRCGAPGGRTARIGVGDPM
jgi:hypothetical protein